MSKNEDNNKENISWEFKKIKKKKYDLPLFSFTEKELEIDFATIKDEKGKKNISIEESITLDADVMQPLLMLLIDVMTKYEDEFKNGKGLKKDKDD
jgi:hypothetical protein